jgi:hypothetical protein
MTTDSPEPAEYELVVAGTLGPVLRQALSPYAAATPEIRAVVLAGGGDPSDGAGDLVDVLMLLEAHGLRITRIQRIV